MYSSIDNDMKEQKKKIGRALRFLIVKMINKKKKMCGTKGV